MKVGSITIGTELDTKEFDAQILQVERRINEIEKELSDNAKVKFLSSREVEDLNVELGKTKRKLEQLNRQKSKLAETKGMQSLSNGIKGVGDGLSVAIKRVSRLALGLFGIRSAYMAIRSASSNLAGYDEQYATNLEYIRYVLTQAIAPVLRWIVQKAMELLQLINMIVSSLFGINLFANGSAESFQKMKAGASGVIKAVKEIKKQLAGFDEINMLTDQSDTGTSAGANGVGMPDMDLSKIQGEVPEWLKWIKKYGKPIIAILAGIAGALKALQIAQLLKNIGAIRGAINMQSIVGIGVAIGGVTYAVMSLLDYLKDPSWGNFGKIFIGIGTAILGVGVALGALPVALVGIAVILYGIVLKYWDKIKEVLKKGIDWLKSKADWIGEHLGAVPKAVYKNIVRIIEALFDHFDNMFTHIKGIFDGVIKFFKGVFSKDWEQAMEGLKDIARNFGEYFKNLFINIFSTIADIAGNIGDAIRETVSGVIDWIGNAVSNVIDWIIDKFMNAVDWISSGIISAVDWVWNNIKAGINWIIDGLNRLIYGLNQIQFEAPDWLGGQKFGINIGYIPNLKTGGIINMPNKGTMLGGMARGGESGQEGVIPLTDVQAMETLGEAIGRYITINANIPVSMNGRIIGRELRQIRNEQEFAYNM